MFVSGGNFTTTSFTPHHSDNAPSEGLAKITIYKRIHTGISRPQPLGYRYDIPP